ncbi:MAG: SBBP repeat-containing protein, partial [Phycisphaerales bacterium JB039]
MKYLHAITLTATAAAITTPVAAEDPYDIIWLTEIGSPGAEFSYEMAVDSTGNVYVGGETDGVLGSARLGGWDAFLAKFDADGSFVWVQQFGTTEDDFGIGVDVDTAGNIYFSGHTKGDLGGMTGKTDAFLAKFDSSGAVQWITQYGAPASFCYGGEVVLDAAGNAIVSGSMAVDPDRDAYAAKFDTTGKMIWISQIGSAHWDSAGGVAIDDSGNVYVCGYTEGDLGGPRAGGNDALLAKFDSFGANIWIEQIG